MAIARTNSSTGANSGSQTGLTVTLSFTPTAGRLLVCCVSSDKTAGTYTITGYTQAVAYSNTSVSGAIFYKIATGSETNAVISQTGTSPNGLSAWVGEYTDVAQPDRTSVSAADETTVTSRSTGTTAATRVADELAIAIDGVDSSSNVASGRAWTNSFSEVAWVTNGASGQPGLSVGEKILSATGTVESTFSYTGTADQNFAAVATFSASGGTARTTDAVVEAVISPTSGMARTTDTIVEAVMSPTSGMARTSDAVVEVVMSPTSAMARSSGVVVEVVVSLAEPPPSSDVPVILLGSL